MSKRNVRGACAGVALALACAFAAVVPADAGDVATFETRLGMSTKAPAFHGKVRSDSRACKRNRRVRLYRKLRPGKPKKLLGYDRSSRKGKWAVTEPEEFTLRSGLYWAVVSRKVIQTPVTTICTRDRSRRVFVD